MTRKLKDHRLTWTPSFRVLNLARFMNDFLSTASHMPTHNTAEPTTYVRLIKVGINEYQVWKVCLRNGKISISDIQTGVYQYNKCRVEWRNTKPRGY